MTIDQQPSDTLRDRFDRATEGPLPTPDLSAAIAGGRRRRRLRATSYAVGSLAVAAVAASAVVVPRLDAPQTVRVAAPVSEVDYVAGTTIDTDLAAAVAAADASLPAPTDVYPADWPSDTTLDDEQFAAATAWVLVYDVTAGDSLTVRVGKPVAGTVPEPLCPPDADVIEIPTPENAQPQPGERPYCTGIAVQGGTIVFSGIVRSMTGGSTSEGGQHFRFDATAMLSAADGHFVTVAEHVDNEPYGPALTDAQREVIAQAPGLDFPDPVEASPAP